MPLLTSYVKRNQPQHALDLYLRKRTENSFHLNEHDSVALLKACSQLQDMEHGMEIHAEVAMLSSNLNLALVYSKGNNH